MSPRPSLAIDLEGPGLQVVTPYAISDIIIAVVSAAMTLQKISSREMPDPFLRPSLETEV